MCSAKTDILPEPVEELKHLSEKLSELIRAEITLNGPMPFSRYMEMALYEPGLGYYSAGLQKFGQGGDFVTAPVISVSGICLILLRKLQRRKAVMMKDLMPRTFR